MMRGLLLARAGGDTIHPSTLELMHELGVLAEFLKLPHEAAPVIVATVGSVSQPVADFTHLPTRCKFTVFMPQWDFLNFLAAQAARYPTFWQLGHAIPKGTPEESRRRGIESFREAVVALAPFLANRRGRSGAGMT